MPSYEERVWIWLQQQLLGQHPDIWSRGKQITIEEVRLEQRQSEEQSIVILFRVAERPQCLFGFRSDPSPPQVLQADGSQLPDQDPEGNAQVIYVNLKESVEAADMGLPKKCIEDDITWI